jgi:hypothetical protein
MVKCKQNMSLLDYSPTGNPMRIAKFQGCLGKQMELSLSSLVLWSLFDLGVKLSTPSR